jgi:tRNA pseudouridine13 synthase
MADVMAGLAYLSRTAGTGGVIARAPEDFVVEEITEEGKTVKIGKKFVVKGESGDYSVFALQKKMWSTQDAIKALADALGVKTGCLSAAGNKDRNAVTAQLISCWGVKPERIMEIHIKDLSVLGCWTSNKPIRVGDLLGNVFRINLEGVESRTAARKVVEKTKGLFPNYFGPQRFGMRGNNHIVGRHIVRGDFQSAVKEFVENGEDDDQDSRTARLAVKNEGISGKTLEMFPHKLNHERTMIRHLLRKPGDFVGAIREIPRNLQMMLVQSYQSHLFNLMLSERVRERELEPKDGEGTCGLNHYGFVDPEVDGSEYTLGRMIGYDTIPTEEEERVLWKEGIETANFKIRHLPELSMKGSTRALLSNIKGFKVSEKERGTVTLGFALPRGSYATVAVREITSRNKG